MSPRPVTLRRRLWIVLPAACCGLLVALQIRTSASTSDGTAPTAGHASSAEPAPPGEILKRPARFPARIRGLARRRGGQDAGIPGGSGAAPERGMTAGVLPEFFLSSWQERDVNNSGVVPGTQSEASVAVFGTNVVVGFNQYFGNQWSGVSYSTDGGRTFTDTGGLPTGGSSKTLGGDPSITACGDGTFYYASILYPNQTDSALSVSVGTFSGPTLSWSDPKVAATSRKDFLDKPWLICDRATNTLYLAYIRFVDSNFTGEYLPDQVEILRSSDGANSWSVPYVLEASPTDALQLPYTAVGPNGELYVAWERGLDDISVARTTIELRRSLDHGATFGPKSVVRTMTPSFFPAFVGYNRESVSEFGNLAVDTSDGPRRGALYVIWTEREPGAAYARDVFVSRSSDGGATWSGPVRVNDDPPGSDQVMPWVTVNSSGTLQAIWYDFRNWPGMHRFNLFAARSADGGATFEPNFRVTHEPSWAFTGWTFIPNFGDYNQAISVEQDLHVAWADSRPGTDQVDTLFSHVPTATCGNGALDPFEDCDDGNTLDGDSCSATCESLWCGNGIVESSRGEECDDGNTLSGDGCSETCGREICGDQIVQRNNHEECDDGNVTGGDGCSATCQIEIDKMAWVAVQHSWLVLESVVTGYPTVIGDPGFHELGDIAFDSRGKLYGATNFDSFVSLGLNGSLIDVAPLGLPDRASFIGRSGWQAIETIDFHPSTGVLYGIGVDASAASHLVTLDPATGATLSTIGNLKLNTARAMAFDADGTLYVSGEGSLYTVNLATAAKTTVGRLSPPMVLSGMDFAPDGTLYAVVEYGTGADGALVRVDKNSAAVAIVRYGWYAQQGIRFAPQIALDHDLDGIHDIADCAPLDPTNAPQGPTSDLIFTDAGTGILTWSPAQGARLHNTYRGTIAGLLGLRPPGSVFDQTCFESGDAQGNGDLLTIDTATPPVGTAYYYLTDGEGACGEGPLGSDASHPVPNTHPCPTPP